MIIKKIFNKLWKKIEFSDNICLFQNYVDRISTNYKEYDAIHIRLVDIAYKSFAYRFIFPDKALIVEFFLAFLLSELPKGKKFIIFTDSYDICKGLINQLYYYKQLNCSSEEWGVSCFFS